MDQTSDTPVPAWPVTGFVVTDDTIPVAGRER
jgi:hypothetical protein